MTDILAACEYLATLYGFFTLDNLTIKLCRNDKNVLREQVKQLDPHVCMVDDIIFMCEFAPYSMELFTLDMGVLALLHQAIDPKNAAIKDQILRKIRIIRSDL